MIFKKNSHFYPYQKFIQVCHFYTSFELKIREYTLYVLIRDILNKGILCSY